MESNVLKPFATDHTYLLLDDAHADDVEGGHTFWERLGSDAEFRQQVERSWLVGTYPVTGDWAQWEMHPLGDEVIVATSGAFIVSTEHADTGEPGSVELRAGHTIVMPARTWHTVDVIEPGAILNITAGEGTEHRPR